ncbi:hypothetical protein HHI36_015423, partial [Cryptolaemus montrouzieri]
MEWCTLRYENRQQSGIQEGKKSVPKATIPSNIHNFRNWDRNGILPENTTLDGRELTELKKDVKYVLGDVLGQEKKTYKRAICNCGVKKYSI